MDNECCTISVRSIVNCQ